MRLWIALLCFVWGSTWWAIRVCLEDQPPLSSAALRFLLAGLAMALLAPALRRRELAPPPRPWLWCVSGLTVFAGSYGVLYVAETVVPSGIAAVLWGIFPLLMAANGVLFLGERLRPRQWIGFLVSFAGIVTVFAGDLGGVGRDNLGPACFLLLSPIVSAAGTTLIKKYGSGSSSVLMNRNGMLLGAVLLALVAFLREDVRPIAWTGPGVLATLYLALFGTTMTFGLYFHLLRTVPASQLSLISYVTPLLAMLLAAAVGDGTTDAAGWAGTALVLAGIALVVTRRR